MAMVKKGLLECLPFNIIQLYPAEGVDRFQAWGPGVWIIIDSVRKIFSTVLHK